MITRTRSGAWSLAAIIALVSVQAEADVTKAQCIAANGNAQSLRREGKLNEAREQLRLCSDPKCPGLVNTDCIKRLDELESAQPTVVFDVKDASGRDLTTVKVTMDGRPLLDKLDGTAAAVNLGEHVFTFTAPDRPSVTRKLVLREGEKARRVSMTLEDAAPTPSSRPASASTSILGTSSATSTAGSSVPVSQKTVALMVTGAGVAGVAVGGVFGYMTITAKGRQTANCESVSSCPDYGQAASAHDEAVRNGTIATIAVLAGAAAATIGIVLFATAKASSDDAHTATKIGLFTTAGPGVAGMRIGGQF